MAALGQTIARGRYVVPSAFTFASMACAFASTQTGQQFTTAAWWIMYCCLLDKLDGTAARLLKAQTRFGVQADSAADLLAFGIAPLFIVRSHPEIRGHLIADDINPLRRRLWAVSAYVVVLMLILIFARQTYVG